MKSKFNKQSMITFLKKEAVLVIATALALCSCIVVPPSKAYFNYIDFRVLSLLFCLMLIVAGFRSIYLFDILAEKLLKYAHTIRRASLMFILLCFWGSMVITNDVALILFVPFSIFTLKKYMSGRTFIFLIVLETLGANLGSMFTPIGNPQNLYIFSTYQMNPLIFFRTMFPYAGISFILLLLSAFLFPKTTIDTKEIKSLKRSLKPYAFSYLFYTVLFLFALATVIRIFSFEITLVICIIFVFVLNKRLFLQVDYYLLLTFIAFFIFVGNLGQISQIQNGIQSILQSHEIAVSILLSQIISNVPATLLLSHFTDNGIRLLIGVNLGGLGTLIASMASLISYKFYAKEKESRNLSYFLWFTCFNLVFLGILLLLVAL
ncbi:MAG: citrate transporter [Eubacterium sp.]|nr:citrate transporter [Eubacterium sp.]